MTSVEPARKVEKLKEGMKRETTEEMTIESDVAKPTRHAPPARPVAAPPPLPRMAAHP